MVTVLIVDDDRKLLKMLRRTLAYEGFRVVTATDGQEALAQVETHRPDVIVLDWLMPGLDGIEVTNRLRAAHDETMILMLTARDGIEDRVEGLGLSRQALCPRRTAGADSRPAAAVGSSARRFA